MKSRRILIVDDSRVEREVLAKAISGWGFQPDMAANGVEALAAVETGQVDLLLLDFLMPLLNGLEIIDQVRKMKNCRDLPIIVVSGASPPRRSECYTAGADCYLSKPVQTGELRQAIEQLLEPPKTGRQSTSPAGP